MNCFESTVAVWNPRRLVVAFYDKPWEGLLRYMVGGYEGYHTQLVHRQQILHAPSPSLLSRIASSFGLKPRPSGVSGDMTWRTGPAIAEAHRFVSSNYQRGDQVILLAEQASVGDHLIEAMEFFAQYLHDGTIPGGPSEGQPGGVNFVPGRRIPIYGIVAPDKQWRGDMESISLVSDGLKSRFPPGIGHIICYGWSDHENWSCSTVFDLDGAIISREISIYDEGYIGVHRSIRTNKDIIYYKPEYIPDWDKQEPVWTKVLESSPTGIPRKFPLSRSPAGTYRQELRRYRGGPWASNRLVLKSFRY